MPPILAMGLNFAKEVVQIIARKLIAKVDQAHACGFRLVVGAAGGKDGHCC